MIAVEMRQKGAERIGGENIERLACPAGLLRLRLGADQAKLCPDSLQRGRQYAARGLKPAIERKLANRGIGADRFVGQNAHGGHDRKRYGRSK